MNRYNILLIGLIVLFPAGCTQNGLSGLAPASGVVLYDGKPVEGALVLFVPDGGANVPEQRPASAETDVNGKFVMMTLQPKDGVFPGKYKVVITKNIPEKVYTFEETQEFFRRGRPTPVPKSHNHLPEKYADAQTTPLEITLEIKGNKTLKYELQD
ncbi:MAG: DUF4198 domain-containing protein [Planctomycetaceae bacterium]|jgi:hypothetical protein|nr:DUF4198 domain-containing protein [Planctomycetaceae bacterium]